MKFAILPPLRLMSIHVTARRLLFFLVPMLNGCTREQPAKAADRFPSLELTMVGSHYAPDSLAVLGASRAHGSLVVWSKEKIAVVSIADSHERILKAPWATSEFISARALEDGGVEAVVSVRDGDRIIQFGVDTEIRRVRRLPASLRFEAAAFIESHWWLDSRHENGDLQISEWDGTTLIDRGSVSHDVLTDQRSPLQASLSEHGGRLLVTLLHSPFTVFSPSSSIGALPRAMVHGTTSVLDSALILTKKGNWVSLPAISAGHGIVQILADMNSDTRLFILRDSVGTPVRVSTLNVPMGLLTSIDKRGEILGIVGTNKNTIVKYRASWRALPTTTIQ